MSLVPYFRRLPSASVELNPRSPSRSPATRSIVSFWRTTPVDSNVDPDLQQAGYRRGAVSALKGEPLGRGAVGKVDASEERKTIGKRPGGRGHDDSRSVDRALDPLAVQSELRGGFVGGERRERVALEDLGISSKIPLPERRIGKKR